jgi:hypothetical protein
MPPKLKVLESEGKCNICTASQTFPKLSLDDFETIFGFAFQIWMLQWLDTLTEKYPGVIENALLNNYPQIEDLNVTRLSGAPLGKFIKKIITKYELDPNLASRYTRTKTVGAFRYLVGEKSSPSRRKSIQS